MRHRLIVIAALASASLLSLVSVGHAESTTTLQNGQRISGVVPTGEVVRLFFPLPAGGEPRLNFTLKGSPIALSILRSDIYDPDGNLVPDTSRYFERTRLRSNKSTLKLRDFVAPKSGMYQLVLETNSGRLPGIVELRASGKLTVKRPTRIKADLDENDLQISVGLQADDLIRASVKRRSGGVPNIAAYVTPLGAVRSPQQKKTKKGAKTGYFRATRDGTYGFEFGYEVGSAEGDFAVRLDIQPSRSLGTAVMRLANAPGIPISVRAADRSTTLGYGVGAPGLAYDGSVFLISALRPGPGADVAARIFDRDLFGTPGTPTPVVLAGPADVGPTETISGHRLAYAGNQYVAAFWTASGTSAWLATYDRSFASDAGLARKTGLTAVTPASGTPVADPFLTTDGDRISLGLFAAPDGHDVHVFEADLASVGTIEIGGGAYAHANGAGVAWHADDEYFDLWAPDTLVPTLPSDLHRQRYTSLWQTIGPESRPVADAGVPETMPTAVVFDPATGATIVHFVVPANAATGDGTIHRVIFDSDGAEVPGSHVALPGAGRNRPTAVIVGSSLFLGTSSPSGPLVERYPLLR